MMLKSAKKIGDIFTNLIKSPKNKAKIKLEAGPAIATFKEPHFLSRKL